MALQPTTWPTIADKASRTDPNGAVAVIGEILNESTDVLDFMPFYEGNQNDGHTYVMRTALPTPTARLLNQGVQPTVSKTGKARAVCAQYTDYGEVDKAIADMGGQTKAFRMSEDVAHIEGFAQQLCTDMIYGNPYTNPAKTAGLGMFFPYSDGPNVINAGGTGSNLTSIWLVGFGPDTVYGIYPKGTKAGLDFQNKGQVTLEDANGGKLEGYRTYYEQWWGLCVQDWRYVVRICNVAADGATTGALTPTMMIQAWHRLGGSPQKRRKMNIRPCFLMNSTPYEAIDLLAMNKNNAFYGIKEIWGKEHAHIRNIPILPSDAILSTESALTGAP